MDACVAGDALVMSLNTVDQDGTNEFKSRLTPDVQSSDP